LRVHGIRWRHFRPLGRRTVATVATVAAAALVAGLATAPPSLGIPKPIPPTPPKVTVTQGQVDAASQQRAALSAQVGQLSGEIAAAKIQLQQYVARAELAEQKYTLALSQLQQAQAAAVAAKKAVETARTEVFRAHARFVQYVQAMYMGGSVDGTAGSLLTAPDPSALLEQSALESYQQQHKADAIGAMEAASVAKSNADARAQLAEQAAAKAKIKADIERKAAEAAVVAEQQQKAALDQQMASTQSELQQKQQELAQLTYGRAQTVKYLNAQKSYQQALSAWQAWKEKMARERARRERERERRQRERERQREHRHHPSGGGGGGGGGGSWHPGPPSPSSGSWTAAKGRAAAARAESQLGLPYAWAGGNAYGPTRGVCVSGDAWNDCHKIGFDCSGLAMYAWGASWWAHYAATQYSQAGHYHPSASNLMPGDLIFWSNGGVWGIHHVAIYIGGGEMVEAPYSGAYVQISSIWEYGGFFGATRPFT
jgi:peptidoglycan DL-endopeptidase RipA